MYQKIREEIQEYAVFALVIAGIYALICIGTWASYSHSREVQATHQTVAQAKKTVTQAKKVVAQIKQEVRGMSRKLIALKHDDTTEIVLNYIQPK